MPKTTPSIPRADALVPVTSFESFIGKGIKPVNRVEVEEMGTYFFILPASYGQVREFQAIAEKRQGAKGTKGTKSKPKVTDVDAADTELSDDMMTFLAEMMTKLAVTEDGTLFMEGMDPAKVRDSIPVVMYTAFTNGFMAMISRMNDDGAEEEKKSSMAKAANEA